MCCADHCAHVLSDYHECGWCGNSCEGAVKCCHGRCTPHYDSDVRNCGNCDTTPPGPGNWICCNGCYVEIFGCRGTSVYKVCVQQSGCNPQGPCSYCGCAGNQENCTCPPGVNGG
jgi:hypothetical protein